MPSHTTPARLVETTQTTFELIESLRVLEGATVSELAERHDLAISTVHDHLATLEHSRYIINDDGEYYVGLRFLDLGMSATKRHSIKSTAKPVLENLAGKCEGAVWLVTEEHDRCVTLDVAEGARAVSTAEWIGKSLPMHCGGAAKAMLAHFSEDRRRQIIENISLEPVTDNTITDPAELEEELEQVRAEGVSFSIGELNENVASVGCAIHLDGDVIGGVSVSGPIQWLSGDRISETVPNQLKAATNEIELRLDNTDYSEVVY